MPLTVDFSALFAAVRQMGAEQIEPPLIRPLGAAPLDPIDIALSETGINVILKDVDSDTGLLAYKGRQVLLYIQDHGSQIRNVLKDGSSGKKYHVAFCKTLSEMKANGRFERYVATNDVSGEFLISGFNFQTKKLYQGKAHLQVCKNCLRYLNYQGYQQGHPQNYNIFVNFSLAEFFATYSSFFPHLPSRKAGENDSLYTPDWSLISRQYRADRHFCCESCGVNLTEHTHLLHTHHRSGVKTDNRPANLQALCLDCHRRQPSHGFMPVRHAEMQLITRLRREQSMMRPGMSWHRIFDLADPGLHGILHHYQAKNWRPPDIGYPIEQADGRVVGQIELAWPFEKFGVAIAENDLQAAQAQGWNVLSLREATDQWV